MEWQERDPWTNAQWVDLPPVVWYGDTVSWVFKGPWRYRRTKRRRLKHHMRARRLRGFR